MSKSKNPISSMTLQGVCVIALGLALRQIGIVPEAGSVGAFVEVVLESVPTILECVGSVMAAYGRIRAKDKIDPSAPVSFK